MPYLFEVTIERELTDNTLREFHHVVAEDIQDVATDFLRDYSADEIIKIERHVSISRNILHQG